MPRASRRVALAIALPAALLASGRLWSTPEPAMPAPGSGSAPRVAAQPQSSAAAQTAAPTPAPVPSADGTEAKPAPPARALTPAEAEEVMARARRLDPTLDFRDLRRLQASKPDFRVSAYISPQYKIAIDNLEAAVGKQDAESIRKRCDAAFKIYFLESKAHALCGFALEKAGDKKGAEYERFLAQGMVASILSTGDGKTWQTAYEVYAVSEEADVLFAAGLVKVDQGTLDGTPKDGKTRSFDVITARDPQTGATQRIFFNVTALYTHYSNLDDKKAMEHR